MTTLGPMRSADVANAGALPVLTVGDASIAEGDIGTQYVVFTVTLSATSTAPVSFSYSTGNATALAANDYRATSGTLTIPAGQPSAIIRVPVFGDKIVEGDETFALHLYSPTGATFAGGASSAIATGTILNDDKAILKMDAPSIVEGDSGTSYMVFTVSLSERSASPITFNYATADGTATAGSDYVATSGTLTMPAGQQVATIKVAVNGDTAVEGNETFKLNLSALSGAVFDGGAATYGRAGTILNDDGATVSINSPSIIEGNAGTTNAIFTVSLSNSSINPVTLSYTTMNGTATAGSDYTATSGTLTIAAGQTSGTISVPVIGDTAVEATETFALKLSALQGGTLSGGAASYAATGTIINDDTPTITLPYKDIVWKGNVGTVQRYENFEVQLSTASIVPVTIAYATVDGASKAGIDYVATSGTLTIPAGQTSGIISVPLIATDDTAANLGGSFALKLSSPANAKFQVGSTYTKTGYIAYIDSTAPPIFPSKTLYTAPAGYDRPSDVEALAPRPTNGQSADNQFEFLDETDGNGYLTVNGVRLSAGQTTGLVSTSGLAFYTGVPGTTDHLQFRSLNSAGWSQWYDLTVTTPAASAAIANAAIAPRAAITAPPLPVVSMNTPSITEGDSGTSYETFKVTLSAASSSAVTLSYATADGTAIAGSDYTAASGTLTIPAGQTLGIIKVAVLPDTTQEPKESFTLRLSSLSGATFDGGGKTYAKPGTIVDDDVSTLTMDSPTITEGNSGTAQQTFTIRLSDPSQDPITLHYETVDGSAKAGADYVATSGTLTIPAHASDATISVPVIGDTAQEGTESYTLRLSSLAGAVFDGGAKSYAKTAAILDDDGPVVSMNSPYAYEDGSGQTEETFTVSLTQASASAITLHYATADGTATAGSDYTATSGTLTIQPGQTSATIEVGLIGDTIPEGNEYFTLRLSALSGASFDGGASSYAKPGRIIDDDSSGSPQRIGQIVDAMSHALSGSAFAGNASAGGDQSWMRTASRGGLGSGSHFAAIAAVA